MSISNADSVWLPCLMTCIRFTCSNTLRCLWRTFSWSFTHVVGCCCFFVFFPCVCCCCCCFAHRLNRYFLCCQMLGGERLCRCRRGFEGSRCQHTEVTCGSVSCRNNGTCTRHGAHFRCLCRPGFTGSWCEHEIDECQSSPCKHGKSIMFVPASNI